MKEGWEYIELSKKCKVQNGFAFNSKDFNCINGLPLIRIRDIKRGFSETYTNEYCSSDYIVENGDLLVGMDGDFNVGIWKGGHALLNQRVCMIKPLNNYNIKFLYYYLPNILNRINQKTSFSTVKHLSSKQVNKINIPDIILDEQRRIVSYLDSSFKLIDEIKNKALKSLTEAKALFQSALAEAMEPKEGWEEKTFGEICTYHKEQKRENGYKYIGMENIESGTGNLIGYGATDNVLSSTFFFKKGEVLYGRLRPYLKKVYIAEFDGCCSTEIFPIKTNGVLPGLIKYWFLTDEITNKINDTSAGCRMPRGNMNEVLQFHLYIPSDKQSQKRIVSHLDKLSSKVRAIEEKYQKMVEECDALKQAMLRDVFE